MTQAWVEETAVAITPVSPDPIGTTLSPPRGEGWVRDAATFFAAKDPGIASCFQLCGSVLSVVELPDSGVKERLPHGSSVMLTTMGRVR